MTDAPGWDAIDAELSRVYGSAQPEHYAPDVPSRLGGEEPLDGISAYRGSHPGSHWHLVSYGMSELYEKAPPVNSFNWDGNSTLAITGWAVPPLGSALTFVGRTSGRQVGFTTQTCVGVNVNGTDITQLCQEIAQAQGGPGDSGSPVVQTQGPSSATLFGILWGTGTVNSQPIIAFSAIDLVAFELGGLQIA